jgi:outer membrane protein assembly factor BamD (BamD/ComL family)
MEDLIKRDDALAAIDAFKRDFEQSWKVQFSADIKALPAVDPVVIHQVDPAAIREAALREAYEVVYNWWFGDGNALPQELILALIGETK